MKTTSSTAWTGRAHGKRHGSMLRWATVLLAPLLLAAMARADVFTIPWNGSTTPTYYPGSISVQPNSSHRFRLTGDPAEGGMPWGTSFFAEVWKQSDGSTVWDLVEKGCCPSDNEFTRDVVVSPGDTVAFEIYADRNYNMHIGSYRWNCRLLPDFAVELIDIRSMATASGVDVQATVVVANLSPTSADAGQLGWCWAEDDGLPPPLGSFSTKRLGTILGNSSVSVPVSFTVPPQAGAKVFHAVADYTDNAPETNESNNRKTATFGLADFAIHSVDIDTAKTSPGGYVLARVVVTNRAAFTDDAGYVGWSNNWDGVSTVTSNSLAKSYVGTLAGNTSLDVEVRFVAPEIAGTHTFLAWCDCTDQALESNETNNTRTAQYTVDASVRQVAFTASSGDVIDMRLVDIGTFFTDIVDKPVPVRPGHTWDEHWFKEDGSVWSWADTIMSNCVALAQHPTNPAIGWAVNTYQISFDSQIPSDSPPAAYTNVTYGLQWGTLPTPENGLLDERPGYKFEGWWTEPNATGTQIFPYSMVTITNATTLYGNWSVILVGIVDHAVKAPDYYYTPGGECVVYCEARWPLRSTLASLLYRPTLPTGWTLASVTGDGDPEIQSGEILLTASSSNSVLRFTYRCNVPPGESGLKRISAAAEFHFDSMINPITVTAKPHVLSITTGERHSADYKSPFWVIDDDERERFLDYWRAGAFHIDAGTDDGYAAGLGNTDGPRHSADFREAYWMIDGTEANRVLAYWRVGGYYLDAEGADGFSVRPRYSSRISTPPGMEDGLFSARLAQAETAAGGSALAAQRLPVGRCAPGSTLTVSCTFTYTGDVTSLLWRPALPAGWSVASVSGEGNPVHAFNEILWTGSRIPASPVTFSYTVSVPSTASGSHNIGGEAAFMKIGVPDPLTIHANVVQADVSGTSPGTPPSAQPVLSVSPAARSVSGAAGNASFAVANSGDGVLRWTATVVSGGSWCRVTSGASGSGRGAIVVSCDATPAGGTPRAAVVRVIAAGASGSPVDITVVQSASQNTTEPVVTAGSFDGYFHAAEDFKGEDATAVRGTLTLKISSAAGRLSAKATLLGGNVSFSANEWDAVEDDGTCRATLAARGGETLELFVLGDRIWGTLQGGKAGEAPLTLDGGRNRFADRGDAAAAALLEGFRGYYTVALPPHDHESLGDAEAAPAGVGYLTVTIGSKGSAKVAGVLADGTKVSRSSRLILAGEADPTACVPFFAPLYTKKGWVGGLLWLDPVARTVTTDRDAGWFVRWEKPGRGPDGFRMLLDACGGFYSTVPELAAGYLFSAEVNEAAYHYADGVAEPAAVPDGVAVTAAGTRLAVARAAKPKKMVEEGVVWYDYDPVNPAQATLSFAARTGIFKGRFTLWYEYEARGRPVLKGVKAPYAGILAPVRDPVFDNLPAGMGHCLIPETDPTFKALRFKRSYPVSLEADE